MPIPLVALAIASTAISAVGSIQAGQAANKAGKYQAQVARNNAKLAVDYGKYNSAVARNNAISARYNRDIALTLGRRNVDTVTALSELSTQTLGVLGEYSAFVAEGRSTESRQRAKVALKRAAFKRAQQQQVVEQARFRVDERRIETRQLVGSQRAQLAANGVVVDEGSAVDIVSSSYELGRRDQVRILADADIDIFDLEVQAYNFETEAASLNREAATHKIAASAIRYETLAEGARIQLETSSKVSAIQYEAAVRAYDFEREAINFDNDAVFAKYHAKNQAAGFEGDAELARARGKSAQTAGYLQAAGTILGGIGNYKSQGS